MIGVFHGALLDANILADVFIHLTGGQSKFEFLASISNTSEEKKLKDLSIDLDRFPIPKILVSNDDITANDQRMNDIKPNRN